MSSYIISIDQSTTSTKVYLIDTHGKMIKEVSHKHQQIYPQSGWVEHDPMEIYHNVIQGLNEIIQEISIDALLGICLTNQRETTVIWDADSGLPLYNAIVWQCRRTLQMCQDLKAYETMVEEKTGLKIDPYFSATKLKWLLDHIKPSKRVMAGTMDSWLLYKLTGFHRCDHTNASRTLLYDIHDKQWDASLCELFQIPMEILPEIKESDGDFGYVNLCGRDIPILSVIGDSQSALYAHGAYTPGDVKITLGTGSSIMMNMGTQLHSNAYGVVSAIAYHSKQSFAYANEAIINSSADTLNWIRDELSLYQNDNILNTLDLDAHGVYLVPAFVGLGIPYWKANAKACISGISRNTTKQDIVIAGMQSIAYQIYDAITALEETAHHQATRISVDGGPSKNPVLMQFLSDITQKQILTFQQSACSAFGVYMMGMQKLGFVCDDLQKIETIYQPKMDLSIREDLLNGWKQAVDMVVFDAERRNL